MFDPKSRYAKFAALYTTRDARGREVAAVTPAAIPEQPHLGDHQLKDGQRLDHLAHFYHDDANGFWRIAAHNGAALPDAVTAAPVEGVTVVRIPRQV
jgi:hypothetical protein